MEITRYIPVDGAAFADFLFLFGQAWVKRSAGDRAGADEDLADAAALVPPGSVEFFTELIESGEWPEPGPDPEAMIGWLERCRLAGAGDLRLLSGEIIKPDRPDSFSAEFAARLAEHCADAERRMASGELGPPPEMPPERPPPWEIDPLKGLNRPGSLSESLRKMGLM
jgi:hypothetical protein